MPYVLGIDLGTTNSCVAVVEGGAPRVIPNKGGYKTTPSVVALTESGKRLVGQLAKRQAITNAQHTVHAAKRLIGRAWRSEQVEHCRRTCAYEVVEGPHGDARIALRGKVYSLPEIGSMILTEMRMVAEADLGAEVTQAVITVPAYFNDAQRQATRDAGRIAGLDVLRIINEPTAAALAYGYNRQLDAIVAVFDLGGGTFDISILEITEGVFDVISTAGDTFLGGEDFDARIIEWLAFGFAEEHGVDLREDDMALQRLKDAAEKAKVELSSVRRAEINLPFIWTSPAGEAQHLQAELTRARLEELVEDLIERTIRICEITLEEAGLGPHQVQDVILVGGMTRMPRLQEAVAAYFGQPPSKSVHPDEAVAMGAAIQGSTLVTGSDDVLLLDVTPLSLGVAVHGGGFDVIIERNTTVPVRSSRVFTTSRDNQTTIKVIVLQGESAQARENEPLGEFSLTGLRAAPAGAVDVEITFDIDADGIVRVSAKDLQTGHTQSISVTASSHLTEDELQSMMAEHQDYLMEVQQTDTREELRVSVQRWSRELERLLASVDAQGSGAARAAARDADQRLLEAQRALERSEVGELREVVAALERSAQTLRAALESW